MNTTRSVAAALAVVLALIPAASAQQKGASPAAQPKHDSAAHAAGAKGDQSAAARAYAAANAKMHHDMDMASSGKREVDLLEGVIPQHQGAIDMAKVVHAHGKDPAISKMAEDIVTAEETEIKTMKDWLAKHEK